MYSHQSKQLGFELPSPKVDYSLAEGRLPKVKFDPSRTDAQLFPEQVAALAGFAQWDALFPCSHEIQIGRSVYAAADPASDWIENGIPGVKAKGIAGIHSEGRGEPCYFVAPRPAEAYEEPAYHIRLEPNFSITPVLANPKALYSLTADGAENEFDCQVPLAASGIGMRSLLAGRFKNADGSAIIDYNEKATGAVFLEFDPAIRSLRDFQWFFVRSEGEYITPTTNHLDQQKITPLILFENYIAFAERTAATKATAIFESGVVRHSSHAANFQFNPTTDRTYIGDTDTTILLARLLPNQRGLQLLRDLSTATLRMIQDFSLYAHSDRYHRYLEDRTIQPFARYLKAFFGMRISVGDLAGVADGLQSDYLDLLYTQKTFADSIAKDYKSACQQGDIGGQWRHFTSGVESIACFLNVS